MLPVGPLSATPFGEILSSRQPLNASPSDSTRELVAGHSEDGDAQIRSDHDAGQPHIAQG